MTEKMKVSELPQAEQDTLINEGKSLNIRGIINAKTWCVDTLKSKIAEAKTNQPPSLNTDNEKSEDGQESVKSSETPVQDEQKQPVNNPDDTSGKQEEQSVQAVKADEKVLICHICRSRVKNGKCTGCGFEVFK